MGIKNQASYFLGLFNWLGYYTVQSFRCGFWILPCQTGTQSWALVQFTILSVQNFVMWVKSEAHETWCVIRYILVENNKKKIIIGYPSIEKLQIFKNMPSRRINTTYLYNTPLTKRTEIGLVSLSVTETLPLWSMPQHKE